MSSRRRAGGSATPVGRLLFGLAMIGFVAFWVWALFFASKEAVNKIDDRAWAARAEDDLRRGRGRAGGAGRLPSWSTRRTRR